MNRKILALVLSLFLANPCWAGTFFDSAGSDYIDTGVPWSWSQISFSAWFKTVAGGDYTGEDDLLANYSSGGSTCDIQFAIYAHSFYCYVRDNASHSMQILVAQPVVDDNQWHNMVCVLSGTTLTLYVDSVFAGNASNASFNGNMLKNTLLIGKNFTGNLFKGYMDDVRIYNRPLSISEVNSLALSRRRLATTDSLVAYYPMDEGIGGYVLIDGSTVKDRSGKGNNGTAHTLDSSFLWNNSNWISYP